MPDEPPQAIHGLLSAYPGRDDALAIRCRGFVVGKRSAAVYAKVSGVLSVGGGGHRRRVGGGPSAPPSHRRELCAGLGGHPAGRGRRRPAMAGFPQTPGGTTHWRFAVAVSLLASEAPRSTPR